MIRRCYRLFLVILALPAVAGVSAQAFEDARWPEGQTVIVGTITHNPPYVLQDPSSSGIDLDLVREAFARVGLKTEFVHAPVSRVQVLLETGKVDAMTTFRTLKGLCTESATFSYWHDGISVSNELETPVHSVKDLAGMHVGMFPGAVDVLDMLTEADVATFGSSMAVYNRDQLIKMFLYQRLDAYIGDYWALEYAYRQLASDKPRPYHMAVAFTPTPRQLCVRDAELTALFNKGVAAILADGTSEKVQARYLDNR